MDNVNVAIIYYSATGTLHALAQAASNTAHGGQESTILALSNTFYHWGGIIVPPGYTDPVQLRSGNPYGASHVAGDGPPAGVTRQAAGHQARRVAETAAGGPGRSLPGQGRRPVAGALRSRHRLLRRRAAGEIRRAG
ncbi:hypothetical protein [Nonomuraea sp. NPDC049758]|uniref:hypothetical protein n=1 Tax=Nonomuraea sp. NPDC049758 TaxID=3154360 RepID=UPI00343B2054